MLKAVELYRADGGSNNPTIAAQLWNLATISIEQGDNNEARERLREATEIYRNVFGDGSSEQARVSVKLAQVLQAEGKWEEAEKMMSSAVPLLTLSPECTAIDSATLFCTQAMACFDAAKYDAADSLYRLSLSIGRRVLPPHNYFLVGIEANMADDYRQLGRFAEMDSLRNEIYGEARPDEPHPRPRVAVDLISFAASYGSQKMYDESTAYYRLALKAQRSFFSQVYPYCSEKDKLKYLNRYQLIIDPVYSLALLSGNDSALSLACDMTIRGKAALIDATSRDKRLIVCSNDQRIKATAERHSVVCTRLAELLLGTADKTAERDSDVLIDSLRILRDSLESELSEYCTAFRDELAARDLGLQDVIEAIPEGTVLWEYKRYRPYDFEGIGRDAERTGAPRYLAFVINHSGDFNLIELGNASVVDSLIQQYRDEINTAGAEVYSPSGLQAEHHLNSISNELFRLLVKPLLSRSEGTRDIIISPDGMLNLIPFLMILKLKTG